jgi:hypothetical protein
MSGEAAGMSGEIAGMQGETANMLGRAVGLPGEPVGLPGGAARAGDPEPGGAGAAARLVFFQHDEVIVHCPAGMAGVVAEAIAAAAAEAGRLVFGPTPVRFPVTTSVVATYADAK